MKVLKKRWKLFVLVLGYLGVAVGGYVYFAAQNPLTQLTKVANQEQFTDVQTDLSQYLTENIKGYVYYEQLPAKVPESFGGFPLTEEAQKQGDAVMLQHTKNIDELDTQMQMDWPHAITKSSTTVNAYGYSENRVRVLPKTRAGVSVSISVDKEIMSDLESYGTGTSIELGVVIDGPTQTIVSVVDTGMENW